LINKNNEGWWIFTDWTEGEYNKYQFNTTLQLWYVRMLESMEYLDNQNSEKYRNKRIILVNNLRKYAWNKKYNIWADSFDLTNQSNGGIIINSLAGKFDLFENKQSEEKSWNYFTNKLTKTAYSQTWVADWGIKLGKYIEVKNIIENYWGGMIKGGATSWWEIYDPVTGKMEGSASHSWGCGPSYLYKIMENQKNIELTKY
jgi:hypothetical protein